MKPIALFAAILLVATLSAMPTTDADHCDSRITVFSYARATGSAVGVNEPVCALSPETEETDLRYIWPGSEAVAVRYSQAIGVDHLVATLDGLGFDGTRIELPLVAGTLAGTPFYESSSRAIDPAARGELHVTVTLPDGTPVDETVYRTIG